MKQALAGFVAGALLAALALKLATRHRAVGPEEEASRPTAEAGSAAVEAPAVGAAAALRDARARLDSRRAELDSLKAAASVPPAGVRESASKRSELAKRYLSRLDEYMKNADVKLPANEEMTLRLQALIRSLAAELGIGLDEVGACPDGFAALAREVLDGLEPKLSAEARAAAEELLEAARREWEELAQKRGEMTRLERGGHADDILQRLMSGLEDRLEDRANDAVSFLDTLWSCAQPTWSGSRSTYFVDSPEEAASQWTARWSSDLGLTPTQKIALRPIVDDYVRGLQELQAPAASGSRERDAGAFDLMVRAQHRLLDTLDLTPEQKQNLDGQTYVYDFVIRQKK